MRFFDSDFVVEIDQEAWSATSRSLAMAGSGFYIDLAIGKEKEISNAIRANGLCQTVTPLVRVDTQS